MVFTLFLLSFPLFTVVFANNDWTKPCFSGVCQYDLPSSSGSSSGTLKIWGAQNSIGDITPAGGWEIIECSPNAVDQDIRLVCKEGRSADCSLLHSAGAEGKIVRLPESCGVNAFAVVTSSWVSTDQSIPAGVKTSLVRRDGSTPQVRALRLSTKFHEVDTSRKTTGAVNFAIQAANVPGASGEIKLGAIQRRGIGRISERGLFDFIGDAVDKIKSLNDFDVNKSTKLLPFNVDKSFNLVDEKLSCPSIDANLKIDVNAKAQGAATIGVAVSGTILPPKVEDFALISSLSADLEGSVDVTAAVNGKLDSGKKSLVDLPIAGIEFPGILSVGPSFKVDAQATANLEIDVGLTVGINYKIDNAQLVFPPSSKKAPGGSFNVGDTPLKLSASAGVNATGTVDAHIIPSLNVGLSVFAGVAKANIFLEVDGSASLNLGVEAVASGSVVTKVPKRDTIEMRDHRHRNRHHTKRPDHRGGSHIIDHNGSSECAPATFVVTKTVYENDLPTPTSLPAKAVLVEVPQTTHASTSTALLSKPSISTPKAISKTTTILSSPSKPTVSSSVLVATATPSKAVNTNQGKTNVNAAFSGCIEVDAGLDVNAGADANFFGLFDKNTKVPLFSKKFELLKKCFGKSITKRSPSASSVSRFSRPYTWTRSSIGRAPQLKRVDLSDRAVRAVRDLLCPASSTASTQNVVDQVVPAASIKQL